MTLQDIGNFFNKFISTDALSAAGNTLARWRVQLFSKTEPITSTSGAMDINVASGTLSVTTAQSTVSTINSSAVALGGAAVFTGTSEDALNYSELRVTVFADQASATDGLSIQQSSNGTNWDITDTYTIAASTGKTFVVPRQARYVRVIYTNGATPNTIFRLQTILNKTGTCPSSQRSSDTYTNETDLSEVWAFNSLWNGTTWDRMRGDSTNGLKAQITTGNVGGFTALATSTITMSAAGAYVTGDYIGTTTTPQSFTSVVRTSGGTGIIKSVRISDKSTTAAVTMELWIFSATFTAPTDNAAWAITDAEAFTCLGIVPIDSSKWYSSSNNKVYMDDTVSIIIKPAATSLFYALVARGSTPTWTSGDLDIGLGILQD